MRLAASRTFWTAGSSRPTRTPMMAMTTSNSISVNAWRAEALFMMAPLFQDHGEERFAVPKDGAWGCSLACANRALAERAGDAHVESAANRAAWNWKGGRGATPYAAKGGAREWVAVARKCWRATATEIGRASCRER